jgi:hypothetical protein
LKIFGKIVLYLFYPPLAVFFFLYLNTLLKVWRNSRVGGNRLVPVMWLTPIAVRTQAEMTYFRQKNFNNPFLLKGTKK